MQEKIFFETVSTLSLALQEFDNFPYEILGVDDFSSTPPDSTRSNEVTSHMLFLEENVGICGAIVRGAAIARHKMVLAVPGTNMYEIEAYRQIIYAVKSEQYDFILGIRNNMLYERPILKYLSSRILLFSYKLATRKFFLKDIHGLNCYRTEDILNHLPPKGRHGGQMQMLAIMLQKSSNFHSVITPIQQGHKERLSARRKDSRPSARAIINAFIGVLRSINISRAK